MFLSSLVSQKQIDEFGLSSGGEKTRTRILSQVLEKNVRETSLFSSGRLDLATTMAVVCFQEVGRL